MASSNNENDLEEKPNLRPTKHVDAGGKTIYLHHNPNQLPPKHHIYAVWEEKDKKQNRTENDPFGIEEPHVEYSLNKHQRWEGLTSFRRQIANQTSSSSDDELETLSDGEQQQQKKKKLRHRRKDLDLRQTKVRLYELHNIPGRTDCVSITTNTGSQRVQTPRKTYMQQIPQNENNQSDVTYYAVVPPPKDKQLANIRKQGGKVKTTTKSGLRSKFPQNKDRVNEVEQFGENVDQSSTDEEDLIAYIYSSPKPGQLSLNDFISTAPTGENIQTTIIADNLVTVEKKFDPKSSRFYIDDLPSLKRFHRQISREEKLYNRDKAVFLEMQKKKGTTTAAAAAAAAATEPTVEKSHQHLMNLSFRSVLINKTDLTLDHLTKTFGKNFLHAQCYPTKYLICLTDRLKSSHWVDKFELFSTYSILNSYLILVFNDETPTNENYHRVQIGLNMDLYSDTIEIEYFYESTESIYRLDDLIKKTIHFITVLPFDRFKPKDSQLTQKKILLNEEEHDLSESEYLNKQIRHLQILDNQTSQQTKTILEEEQLNSDLTLEDYDLIKPDICTSCYRDMNETIPMTAIQACAHWFCNDCWKQYLESSIKSVKLVLCPEWNCESIVDVGTILSLVNVRCMNIYERNIEKCLVNLSRSFVKCPSKSCENIVQVIGPSLDHVRRRCGEIFCISCKKEAHFPATCSAYHYYIDEVHRNGDMISDYNAVTQIKGRNCISCNNFIEKNGGCNHMTCRCGAEFCWTCTGYWKDHNMSDGTFRCPKETVPLQEEVLAKQHNTTRRYYYNAIYHRRERTFQNQSKQKENAKRLLGTIPLDKNTLFDNNLVRSQVDKRESILKHLYEMVRYIWYLHRICEFVAVSADGYGNTPQEFRNSIQPFETIVFNMGQVIEGGRGYKAIEQIKQLHQTSEKLIERLQRAVTVRELRRKNTTGYATS